MASPILKWASNILHPVGHEGKIMCCYLKNPIGISGSEDASAKIWNVEEKTLLRTLAHHEKVHAVAMNSCSFFTGTTKT